MFHELDDGTRCSYPVRRRFTISGRISASSQGSSSVSRRSCRTTDQNDRDVCGSSLRGKPAVVRPSAAWKSMSGSLLTLLGTRPAIVKLGGRYDASPIERSTE